jgi:hypothetical protein
MHGYFKELGGSWQILVHDVGLYLCMFLAIAFVAVMSMTLQLGPDQFGTPDRATIAAEKEAIDKE